MLGLLRNPHQCNRSSLFETSGEDTTQSYKVIKWTHFPANKEKVPIKQALFVHVSVLANSLSVGLPDKKIRGGGPKESWTVFAPNHLKKTIYKDLKMKSK